jgi:hypothetical protein
MKHVRTLALPIILAAAWIQPGAAQVYWSNTSPMGVTDDISCVSYGNGTFAAVTNQGNLLTSIDGLTWNNQAIASGTWLQSIAYGPKGWVVVGGNGTILASADLKTWVNENSGTTNRLNGVFFTAVPDYVEYDNPNFCTYIAVGDNGIILTSPDAQTWSIQPSGVSGSLYGVTFSETAGTITGSILVSGDGGVLLRGSNSTTPGFAFFNSSGTGQNIEALYSNSSPYSNPIAIGVGSGGTIINNTSTLFFSGSWSNGTTSPSTTATLSGLTYGNGYWVAAGELGTIETSTDGINWVQRFSGDSPSTITSATLLSAAYSPALQRFVITGANGTILVSGPAPTVFANVSTRGIVSSAQTFIGGFVIEGTTPRVVLIRADGPVLGQFSVSSPLPDPVLTVYDSMGNVVATNTGWTSNTNPSTISSAARQTGAFALPNPSADSALLLTLQPGAYTAQITSAKGNSGVALFEAYTD